MILELSFIIQAKQLDLKAEMLTSDSFLDSDISEAGPTAENIYATKLWFKQEKFPR